MRLEDKKMKEYFIHECPSDESLYFKPYQFKLLLGNKTYKKGYRKNRESKDVINYIVTENNIIFLINRLLITNSTGVGAYIIPKDAPYISFLLPFLDLKTDISDEEIQKSIMVSTTFFEGFRKPHIETEVKSDGRIGIKDIIIDEKPSNEVECVTTKSIKFPLL